MVVRTLCFLAVVAAMCPTFCQVASASIYLTPTGLGTEDGLSMPNALGEIATGTQTAQPQINAAIAGFLGSSVELYKKDHDPPVESGSFAASYSTLFDVTPADPSMFTIEWDGGSFISGATHLLVKDGNQDPAWYLFNISGLWDGMADIIGFDFWPSKGAISHVTIYGSTSTTGTPPGAAPEAASFMVWSLLISAVGMANSRRCR